MALNISYLRFSHVHRAHTNTHCHKVTYTYTHHKVMLVISTTELTQQPQIRLHVTFPIKGFLKRLNPGSYDIPVSRAEHRLTFLCTDTCLLAGGSATLIPDFHKIRGLAVSIAAVPTNYRCDTRTHAYAHTYTRVCTLPHRHNNTPVQISPG